MMAIAPTNIKYGTGQIRVRPKARKGNRRPEFKKILSEDIELLKSFRGVGAIEDVPYFRHPNGKAFGNKFLSRVWEEAVNELKHEGKIQKELTLYEGTKHTTITESDYQTETTQKASGHRTVKAHAHYDHKLEEKFLEVYKGSPLTWNLNYL